MKKVIFILISIFILQAGLPLPANAQVKQVRIKVNGLACPFCAYGLEKKFKKFDGVGKVTISLNKGMATLDNKENQSIEFENLASAVTDAGFSATEITATVKGVISKSDDIYLLSVVDSDEKLILENNEVLQSLLSSLNGAEKEVSVKGAISQKQTPGHKSHPFALSIQQFEMK